MRRALRVPRLLIPALSLMFLCLSGFAYALDVYSVPSPDAVRVVFLINSIDEPPSEARAKMDIWTHAEVAPTLVRLNSPGGRVKTMETVGQELIQYARRYFAELGLALEIQTQEQCDSACTLLLTMFTQAEAAGEPVRLRVSPPQLFTLHSARFANGQEARLAQRAFARELIRYGANARWLEEHLDLFGETPRTISADALCTSASGILTPTQCARPSRRTDVREACARLPACEPQLAKVLTEYQHLDYTTWAWFRSWINRD